MKKNISLLVFACLMAIVAPAFSYDITTKEIVSGDYPVSVSFRGIFFPTRINVLSEADQNKVNQYPELLFIQKCYQHLRDGNLERYLNCYAEPERDDLRTLIAPTPERLKQTVEYAGRTQIVAVGIVETNSYQRVGTIREVGAGNFTNVTFRLVRKGKNDFEFTNKDEMNVETDAAKTIFNYGVAEFNLERATLPDKKLPVSGK